MSKRYIIRDPLSLHREGVLKSRRLVAWKDNISVAEYIAEFLKPCLGPRGMHKIVIDKFDETGITNDGAVILDKLDLHHPVAKVLREAAKTVETMVGDGSKTTIILIGELLKRAERLVSHKVKVSKIIDGYLIAYNIALKRLREISRPIGKISDNALRNFVFTLFNSKNIHDAKLLADITTEALNHVIEKSKNKELLDTNNIRIVKKIGKSLEESIVIKGIVIDKKIVHPSMPRIVKDARIAVLNMALKIDEFRHLQPYKYQINISNPLHVTQFLEEERNLIKDMVNKIVSLGVNAVICRKRISKIASQLLADAGVMAIGRLLKEEDFNNVARFTGANIVSDLNDLREEDLGKAALIREEKIGEDKVVIIEGCDHSEGVTILLRAGLERLLDEVEHAIKDAVKYVASLLQEPLYVPGGGAVEEALAITIRDESTKYSGKEQVAMHAFANALENIPRILISNSGYNPVDIIPELRSKHVGGEYYYGFDPYTGAIANMLEKNVVESYKAKEQILKTSVETAIMLLRIDEVVDRRYAKRHEGELGGQ